MSLKSDQLELGFSLVTVPLICICDQEMLWIDCVFAQPLQALAAIISNMYNVSKSFKPEHGINILRCHTIWFKCV